MPRVARPLALLALTWFAPVAVASGTADEAEIDFRLGATAYQDGDYQTALAWFLASNRLSPNANVAFNIARCYARLQKYPEAYRWYIEARRGVTEERALATLSAEIDAITPRVAVYELVTDPPGATVYVDRRDLGAVGVTPLTLAYPPGDHAFLFELDGYEPLTTDAIAGAASGRYPVSQTLERIVGRVEVTALEGATVHQGAPDGPVLCVAPCSLDLAPGPWVLWVRKAGFRDVVRQVEVLAGRTAATAVELAPETGALVLDASETGALIEIDGQPYGFTPAVVPNVPVGERIVRISRRGFAPIELPVIVERDAQVTVDRVEMSPLDEVTAVSRLPELIEDAPSSVSLLSREELTAFAYPTIYEAMRTVRGTSLTYDSVYGSVGVRGLGQANDFGNRLLILQDGSNLNDNILWQSFVGYDGRVDLGDLDHIEVVRGPGSVLYGTGAVSGVVNLVTKPIDDPTGSSVTVSTTENRAMRGRASTHYNWSDRGGFRASVSGAYSPGRTELLEVLDEDGALNPVRVNKFDAFRAGGTNGRVWLGDASLQWFHNTRSITIPTGIYAANLDDPTHVWVDGRTMLEFKYEPKLSDTARLSTRVTANRYTYDGNIPFGEGADHYDSVERYVGNSVGAEVRAILEPTDTLRVSVGAQVDVSPTMVLVGDDLVEGEEPSSYMDVSEPYFVAAAYGVVDWAPSQVFRLNAAARLDYWSTFGVAPSPRLAAIVKPTDKDVVKIMGGRAFRAPSPYELGYRIEGLQYAPGEVGIDLTAETVWSGEVEYTRDFGTRWTGLVSAHGGLANNFVETITLDDPPDAITYANSDEPVRILGADLEVQRKLQRGWMVTAYYSALDSRFTTGDALANVPTHDAGLKVIAPLAPPFARLAFRASYEGPRRLATASDRSTKPALIADLVLSGSAPDSGLSYHVGLYNLFDQAYGMPLTDTYISEKMPQQRRSLLAGVTLDL